MRSVYDAVGEIYAWCGGADEGGEICSYESWRRHTQKTSRGVF